MTGREKRCVMRNLIISEDLETIAGFPLDWKRFAGKTVLVSGANGFLPAYMVETLLYINETWGASRVKVIGVVRNLPKAQERFAHYLERDDLQLISQDICQPLEILGHVDYIIHAASQASPKYFGKDPVGTLSANIFGTRNLLDLARNKKIQGFLFFSSGEIYGEVREDQIPTCEDGYGYVDPVSVRSCYAESKRMGENMCVSWHHQYGVPAKIVRPFHTYGPGMGLDDGRVFADFVADVVHRRDIIMMSDGSAKRAFCYLADAVAGFFTVLLRGAPGEAYNIGNDRCEISILELAELLASLAPEGGTKVVRKDAPSSAMYMKSVISRNCPDIAKAKSLGWEPVTDLVQGFKRTIRSFV